MAEIKNTYIDLELEDGEKVQLSLAFYLLYQLRAKNKAAYEKYNAIMTHGAKDEFENITVIYTGYLCANLDRLENCMTEIEFMQRLTPNREVLSDVLLRLIKPKKK